ncbi:unnamed protein product [Trichobilharzia regenti]|nr:unnamed protein product [Trichobilharzia regenti]
MGWDYGGLVPQYGLALTVMDRMFDALEQCRLVKDRNECEFSVCGRTDKGVSCNLNNTVCPSIPEVEMDYVSMLNQNLPRDIRVLAWSPVSSDFSARFDCLKRTYEYYFPEGGLDIKVRIRSSRLVGVHDFRNFCASRIEKETVTFVREIFEVSINLVDGSENHSDEKNTLKSTATATVLFSGYVGDIFVVVGDTFHA